MEKEKIYEVDVCNIDKNVVGLSYEKDCPFEIVKRSGLTTYR